MRKVFPSFRIKNALLLFVLVLLLLGIIFKDSILRQAGHYLVAADPPKEVDALVVLGGSPVERAHSAAQLFENKLVTGPLICTGGNESALLKTYGIDDIDAEMTLKVLLEKGIDSTRVVLLPHSTSTFEEAEDVLNHCRQMGYSHIGVISSNYHLRRVRFTFKRRFSGSEVGITYFSANSESFSPENWWKNEDSVLIGFSEYVKLFYYLLKY